MRDKSVKVKVLSKKERSGRLKIRICVEAKEVKYEGLPQEIRR